MTNYEQFEALDLILSMRTFNENHLDARQCENLNINQDKSDKNELLNSQEKKPISYFETTPRA